MRRLKRQPAEHGGADKTRSPRACPPRSSNRGNGHRDDLSGPLENWSSPPQRAVLGVAHYAASSRLERPRVERSVPLERRPELDPRGYLDKNARVMLEMADYAMRNSDSVDRVLLETLRSDAMQIRVCVMMALAQYAFSHASEGVRVNAFRAASMHTGMADRKST